ncbi:MAG: SMP-30/gluconolactonase/LRE family protein [Rhizobiaceae bacterium]|jgi:sugar lactone lactonase YvrE
MQPDVVCITPERYDLGESLFWDAEGARLYWIDAWKATVCAHDPATGDTRRTEFAGPLGGRPIGSIACREGGGLIGGVRGGFYRLDTETAEARLLAEVEADRPPSNRLNDGKCDRAGRFWCASVNTDHRTASAALWRFDSGGDPRLMQDGLIVGNGIAWSPDDRSMYLADTPTGRVWQYEFDLARGEIANRRPFLSIEAADGAPDGATVDADGCYWSALFRGGAVAQFDPGGKLMRRVDLPVSNPTICAFGDPGLDTLYVATASRFLDEEQLRAQPLAGRVFAVRGLGARGLPETRFKGSSTGAVRPAA